MVTVALPKIRLLGEPVLESPGGGRLPFRTHKVPALLGYLVARAGRPSPRTEIAEALWPDREPAPALQNLRQTLLYLRGLVGDALLLANRREVRIQPGLADCDVEAFRAALARDPERAVALYTGPFLAGHDDDWVIPLRAELSHAYVKALLDLSDRDLDVAPDRALRWAERAVAEEPFHDGARARKIRALRRQGEETRALREYEAYESLLDEELGLRPAALVEDALADRPMPGPALRTDRSNPPTDLADALRVLREGGRPEDAVRLAASLAPYWLEIGAPREGLRRLDEARAGWPLRNDPALVAQAAHAAGTLATRTGDTARAIEEARSALALAVGPRERVETLVLLAHLRLRERDTYGSRRTALEAARLARAARLPADAALVALALAHAQEGRPLRNVAASRRALAAPGASARALANAGISLSEGLGVIGRIAEAREALARAVAAIERDRSHETTAIRAAAARQAEELGELAAAERGYEETIAAYRRREDDRGLAICLTYLADFRTERGEPAASIPLHEEALALRRAACDVLGEATNLRGLGAARLALGDLASARDLYREAVRAYAAVDHAPGISSCLLPLARVETAIGARPLARRLAARAVALLRDLSPGTRANIGPRGAELLPQAESLLRELAA